jgi:hypothetical protein
MKIKKEKDEMSHLVSCLKDEKQELEFHKNLSTNNQLSNSMSMSSIVDVISWILVSVFWMFVICLRKTTNS